jgi:hypothetical protein
MTSREITVQRIRNKLGSRSPKCCICGYAGIAALTKFQTERLTQKSRSILQEHHVAGLHEGGTIIVCLTHHAELTNDQLHWPDDLKRKDRDSATYLHALAKGCFDSLAYWFPDRRFRTFAAKVYKKTIEAMNRGGMISARDVQTCAEEAFRCCFLDAEPFSNLPMWDI